MKNFKRIILLISALTLSVSMVLTSAACSLISGSGNSSSSNKESSTTSSVEGENNSSDKEEPNSSDEGENNSSDNNNTDIKEAVTYKFEAEFGNATDDAFDNWIGGGLSNTPTGWNDAICYTANASNERYVTYMHRTDSYLYLDITSDVACDNVKLVLCLGNELSKKVIDNTMYKIEVNGEEISYEAFTLPKGSTSASQLTFTEFTISENISLKAGNNVIKLSVQANTWLNGASGAPLVDYITLSATSTLSYTYGAQINYGSSGDLFG